MTLDQLAGRIAEKDGQAFEEVYNKLRQPVFAVCLGILKNQYDAEDIMQETFITVWTKVESYKGNGFKTWVLTIARNKSLNFLKNKYREVPVDLNNESVQNNFDKILDNNQSDDKELSILSLAIKHLQDVERQIVILRVSGLKMKEAAQLLNIPRGTASWHYSESIKKLKKIVKEEMKA